MEKYKGCIEADDGDIATNSGIHGRKKLQRCSTTLRLIIN